MDSKTQKLVKLFFLFIISLLMDTGLYLLKKIKNILIFPGG